MAVYQFKDDGIKGSMDALAGIMQTMGEHERQRQDFQLSQNLMKIASEPAASPQDRLQKVYSTVANFQPQNSGGLSGVMQRIGGMFARPSEIPGQYGNMAMSDIMRQVTEERGLDRYGRQLEMQEPYKDKAAARATDQFGEQQQIVTDQVSPRAQAALPSEKELIAARGASTDQSTQNRYDAMYGYQEQIKALNKEDDSLDRDMKLASLYFKAYEAAPSEEDANKFANAAATILSRISGNPISVATKTSPTTPDTGVNRGAVRAENKGGFLNTLMNNITGSKKTTSVSIISPKGTVVDDVSEEDAKMALERGWRIAQ